MGNNTFSLKENIKITVITVCYNAEGHIEQAIKSVLSQTYKNIEYIIVDGKSTDKTLEIVNRYKENISKIISEPDKGIYDAMNKGIKLTEGNIIYFLNADDKLYDEYVFQDIVNEFNSAPDVGVIYGKVNFVNVPTPTPKWLKRDCRIRRKEDLLGRNLCHQSLFAKRDIFNKTGLFNTKYKIFADYDWVLSLYKHSIKMKFIDRLIVTYNFCGYSYQNSNSGDKERTVIVFKHFSLPIAIFYIFRYVFLRRLDRKIRLFFRRNFN